MIIEYQILASEDPAGIVNAVNEKLKQGYEPLGGLCTSSHPLTSKTLYVQAIVKREEKT